MIDFDASEFTIEGDVALITAADFAYILVKPTDRTGGLEPLVRADERRSRRRVWL